jgi:hypothetical protein
MLAMPSTPLGVLMLLVVKGPLGAVAAAALGLFKKLLNMFPMPKLLLIFSEGFSCCWLKGLWVRK